MKFTHIFFSLLLTSSAIIFSSAHLDDAEDIGRGRRKAEQSTGHTFIPQFNFITPREKPTGIAVVAQSAQDGVSAGITQGIGIVVAHGIQSAINKIWEYFVPDEQKELHEKIEYLKALGEIIKSAPNEEIRKECMLLYGPLAQKLLNDAQNKIDPYKTVQQNVNKKSKQRNYKSTPVTIPFNFPAAQNKPV